MAHLPHKCESEAQEDGLLLLLEGFSLRAKIGRVGDFCLGFIHIIIPYKYHHFDSFVPRSNVYYLGTGHWPDLTPLWNLLKKLVT